MNIVPTMKAILKDLSLPAIEGRSIENMVAAIEITSALPTSKENLVGFDKYWQEQCVRVVRPLIKEAAKSFIIDRAYTEDLVRQMHLQRCVRLTDPYNVFFNILHDNTYLWVNEQVAEGASIDLTWNYMLDAVTRHRDVVNSIYFGNTDVEKVKMMLTSNFVEYVFTREPNLSKASMQQHQFMIRYLTNMMVDITKSISAFRFDGLAGAMALDGLILNMVPTDATRDALIRAVTRWNGEQ